MRTHSLRGLINIPENRAYFFIRQGHIADHKRKKTPNTCQKGMHIKSMRVSSLTLTYVFIFWERLVLLVAGLVIGLAMVTLSWRHPRRLERHQKAMSLAYQVIIKAYPPLGA